MSRRAGKKYWSFYFPTFTLEELDVIVKAFDYIKNHVNKYRKENIDEVDKCDISIQEIDDTIKYLLDKNNINKKLSMSNGFYLIDVISSVVKPYLNNLEKEFNDTNSEKILDEILIISKIMDRYGFESSAADIYKDYIVDKSVLKTDRKLIFVSYSLKDKKISGLLHEVLTEQYNYDVFLAHELIEINEEWRKIIIYNLNKCTGLVAIVTDNFIQSVWANQEIGYILGLRKPIVSLFYTSSKKSGFLESLQGIICDNSGSIESLCDKIDSFFSSI